jgi:hypothetical protein
MRQWFCVQRHGKTNALYYCSCASFTVTVINVTIAEITVLGRRINTCNFGGRETCAQKANTGTEKMKKRRSSDPAETLHQHAPKTRRVSLLSNRSRAQMTPLGAFLLVWQRDELARASRNVCWCVLVSCDCTNSWFALWNLAVSQKGTKSWMKGTSRMSLYSYTTSILVHG